MKRKLNINNLDIGAKSENVDYTNSGMAGVTNIKDAMDNIAGRVNNLENESGGGSSGGGGSQEEQSDIVMYVIGSSSATDRTVNNVISSSISNDGATHYHTIESVYQILARKLKVKKGNYTNVAVGGQVVTKVAGNAGDVPTNATHVFIQYGANGFTTSAPYSPPLPLGYVNDVINYSEDDSELDNTLAGLYRKAVDKILSRCGKKCKVYFVTQLWNSGWDDTSIAAKNKLYNEWRQTQYDLYKKLDAVTVNGVKKYNVGYIRGPLMGIYKDNQSKYLADGVHPNRDGAEMVADHILCEMFGYPLDSPTWRTNKTSLDLVSSGVGTPVSDTYVFNAVGDFSGKDNKITLSVHANNTSSSILNAFSVSPSEINMETGRCSDIEITVTYTPIDTNPHTVFIKINRSDYNNVGYLVVKGSVG